MMHGVAQRYAYYFNGDARTGALWEGRYRSCIVESARYVLACYRYIELNPVRAGITKAPGAYRWSSYLHNAKGSDDPNLSPHGIYLSLGASSARRCASYRRLFEGSPDSRVIDDIRSAWQSGTPLGDDGFRQFLEQKLGRKLGQTRRGRPPRTP